MPIGDFPAWLSAPDGAAMEVDTETGATTGRLADADRSAMVLHDFLHQMQAQATAATRCAQTMEPVSYTHLTLPTICSV